MLEQATPKPTTILSTMTRTKNRTPMEIMTATEEGLHLMDIYIAGIDPMSEGSGDSMGEAYSLYYWNEG